MKVIFKYLLVLSFLGTFFVPFANAQTNSSKNLAVGFSFSDIFKEAAKSFSSTSVDSTSTDTTTTDENIATGTASTTIETKDSCGYFDDALDNVLNLENSSVETRGKIDKVESTIDGETPFRDSILSSLKDFASLQKKDKAIFIEMKKNISDARNYYDELDSKVEDTQVYLDENFCEDISFEDVAKIASTTKAQVDGEATFRKQLSAGLKDKIKFLQDSVASAKKK